MSEFKTWGKIPQFRDVAHHVNKNANYHDEDLPTITFYGSVKLHGTNSAVGWDDDKKELYIQSRNHKLPLDSKHYGFGQWVEQNKEDWEDFFLGHCREFPLLVFGEWAGQGVQKNVGVSSLEKQFYIFPDQFISQGFLDEDINWGPGQLLTHDYEVDIDFNDPNEAIKYMMEITEKVEDCCPVAGKGVGEGVVWRTKQGLYRFKVKGEKHSSSKVKTISAAPPYLKELTDFLTFAVTENRVKQGIFETKAESPKDIGDIIKWVANDILTEEILAIEKSTVELKHIKKGLGGAIAKIVKRCMLQP